MTKFNVGDKVRVTGDSMNWWHEAAGETHTITGLVDGESVGYPSKTGYHLDGDPEWDVAEEDLEAVESTPVRIWSQFADELVRAAKALDELSFPEGELEFNLDRVNVTLYGQPSGYALVHDEGVWYIEVTE